MQRRGSSSRLPGLALRSRISALVLAMAASIAAVYVAGRLWQDAQDRVYLIKELDTKHGQGHSAITVDESLKLLACRDQRKRLAEIEMDLASAKHEGYLSKYSLEISDAHKGKKLLVVIGISTGFGGKHKRTAIRKSWLPTGAALKKLEREKGVLLRFVIGRSANRGDSSDRAIDDENRQTHDFIILDNHIEASEELPKKTKLFFGYAADTWDAEFYAKVNDDFYVNIDAFGAMLATHLDKPRAYIGCMKSGKVVSEPNQSWYEPDWWKFGDKKSYFRHASGEIFVISRALAQFISINRSILRTYAHDDVSVGSWMLGLNARHIHEGKLCCSYWSSGNICVSI